VTNTDDTGAGSLRAAITTANALIGHDAITFAPGLTGTVNLQSVLPALTGSIEIDGPGLDQLTVRRDFGGNYGIFSVSSGAEAQITGLTITNGAATNGGGVSNAGRLLLDRVLVSSNSATNRGGGVYNTGSLTVKASTLAGNNALAGGGGLQAVGGRLTLVLDSAISGNQSGNGGAGIDDYRGSLEMHTSTVSGNTVSAGVAAAAGGVLILSDKSEWDSVHVPPDAPAEIVDSTIAGNTHLASHIANLMDKSFTPAQEIPSIVKSTIVANPLGGGPNCDGPVSSAGFNLESADTCGFSAPSDRPSQNPQLGPLADNGGPTQTMALPLASPAVDAGSSTSGPSDQRGLVRPVDQAGTPNAPGGNASDIGAFELEAQPSASVPQPPAQPVQPAPSKKCKKGQKLKKGKCVKKKKRR
jgi:predicted outer membrane repeat protein